jgi:VIT1/CCC1 family predicted Fe2+/Mn2+ transporter
MIEHRNPAALRHAARLALETRLATGRPYRAAESRGLSLIVVVAIIFGGIVPVAAAFLRPVAAIIADMVDVAPVGLFLLFLFFFAAGRRRRGSRTVVRSTIAG